MRNEKCGKLVRNGGKMRNAEFCAVCRRESVAVAMSNGRRRPKCTCLSGLVKVHYNTVGPK